MEIPSNLFPVQYAVIQLRQSNGGAERFVMGYQDERALRQLLDKRSIVATGFLSRDEATRESFKARMGNYRPLLNFTRRFLVSASFYQLRILKMQTLSRLKIWDGALRTMSNLVHLAGGALHKSHSRLTRDRRRLESAVQ